MLRVPQGTKGVNWTWRLGGQERPHGELAGWVEQEASISVAGDLDLAVPRPWQPLPDSFSEEECESEGELRLFIHAAGCAQPLADHRS